MKTRKYILNMNLLHVFRRERHILLYSFSAALEHHGELFISAQFDIISL